MTVKTITVDYSDVEPHRQGWDLDEGKTVALITGANPEVGVTVREFKVRLRVHHDTSYWFQSQAVAEVWSRIDLAWHETATVLPSTWADHTNPEAPGTGGMWEAEQALMARTVDVLEASL